MNLTRTDLRTFAKNAAPHLAVLAMVSAFSLANAANINLVTTDGLNQSSFNSGTNWSNAQAPSSDNDYYANGLYIRTPENANANQIFAGRSLNITGGGALVLKNTADATINVSSLSLNNGYISHFGQGNSITTIRGSLTVNENGGHLFAANGEIWLNAATTLNGNLTVWGSSNPALGVQNWSSTTFNNGGQLTLSSESNLQGSSYSLNFIQAFSSTFQFQISDANTLPFITGAGTANRINAVFGGRFSFDLASVHHTIGDSWQIIDIATIGQLTYGENFSLENFTASEDGLWLSNDGKYAFSEATGYLTAVPEPASWAAILSAFILIGIALKRRRN